MTTEQVLSVLTETPTRLTALARGRTAADLTAAPEPGEWSPAEVLAHLRACADMWGSAITAIAIDQVTTIRAVSPRTWIQETDYLSQPFRPALRAFTTQREELLAVLRDLQPDGWSRTTTVTGAGKPLDTSVQSYADRLARHEHAHVGQIARSLTL